LVVAWVRGAGAEDKTRPDLADLLEAERVEMREGRAGPEAPPR
jgi:hypothetical protein